jgi:hypothetical protein
MIQLPGHLVSRYQAYCRGCGIIVPPIVRIT